MTDRLVAALRNLAGSSELQIAYLEELGVAPSCDELALELEDALVDSPASSDFTLAVNRILSHLDKMSGAGRASLWHVDALETAQEWEETRRLAAAALDLGGYTGNRGD